MDWTAGEHERSRLAARYHDESDRDLLALHSEMAQLTPIAQEALLAEMKRRGVSVGGSA